MKQALNIQTALIFGLGQSSLSCAQFLERMGCCVFGFVDTRCAPSSLPLFKEAFPNANFYLGEFDQTLLEGVDTLVLSPGFDPRHPVIDGAKARDIAIVGDVELFARVVDKPVIGITGTNGKSTVTLLVAELLKAAGFKAEIGGNFGLPAVELLSKDADVYVLELSSFQLETTESLDLVSATILNVSDDHADRYDDYADYVSAKQKIYRHAKLAIINADDEYLSKHMPKGRCVHFSLEKSDADFRLDRGILHVKDSELCLDAQQLKIQGSHNVANVLAAVALVSPLCELNESMRRAVYGFSGLPHRVQWVRNINGVDYYNDSKATNVGATIAALRGLKKQVALILGGVAKDQDFSPIQPELKQYVRCVLLIGHDADLIEPQLGTGVAIKRLNDLNQAIEYAQSITDIEAVLLSPACASFDHYSGFEERGDHFIQCVQSLPFKQGASHV